MAVENKEEKVTLESLEANISSLTKTVGGLALMMKQGFIESEKRIIEAVDTKIEELATITKHGFDGVDERVDKFEKNNSREHEDMALRLDNVAYRFELVELKQRVAVLEKKVAVRV